MCIIMYAQFLKSQKNKTKIKKQIKQTCHKISCLKATKIDTIGCIKIKSVGKVNLKVHERQFKEN